MKKFTELVDLAMKQNSDEGFGNGVSSSVESDLIPYTLPWYASRHLSEGHSSEVNWRVKHPKRGDGTVTRVDEDGMSIQWDRLGSWVNHGNTVSLQEATNIIMTDFDKYNYDDLSEGTDMTKIDMTAADYDMLLEGESPLTIPSPSDTILTKQADFKSDAEGTPLSALAGDGGANPSPQEEGKSADGAPDVPAVDSMDDPARQAKITKGGGGFGSNQFKKSSKKSSSDDYESKDKGDEDEEMKEGLTFEDYDLENMEELNHLDEHDMGAGEIAVTKEFMAKLLQGVSGADLDEDAFNAIADCLADCCEEDRALDVSDIDMVMSELQAKMDGGDADVPAGDGEIAGDEGGDDMEGETQLMGDDDMEECGDYDMEEGSQEDRRRGRDRRRGKDADKKRFHKGGDRDKSAYRKEREDREDLEEAWMGALPTINNREQLDTTGMDEEEAEMARIKRLAGMI